MHSPPLFVLFIGVFIALLLTLGDATTVKASCYYESPRKGRISYGSIEPDADAWGYYDNAIMKTGWDLVTIEGNSKSADVNQMFAGGFCEGALTHSQAFDYYCNFNKSNFNGGDLPPLIKDYFKKQDAFIADKIEKHGSSESAFWNHVSLVLQQVDGFLAGYANACSGQECSVSLENLKLLFYAGDLEDLIPWESVMTGKNRFSSSYEGGQQLSALVKPNEKLIYALMHSACSAFVRVTDNDVFVGHSLWTSFSNLNRAFKYYTFPLSASQTSATTTGFSSRPADYTSKDDFYVLSSKLAVLETSLTIFDDAALEMLSPLSVPSFLREVVANRMASSPDSWREIFMLYSSTTHNAQWIVVDTSKITPGNPSPPNTAVIVEESPTARGYADATDKLDQNGYLAGYNLPSFKNVYEASGTHHMEEEFGHWFDYEKCPRAQIFARDAPKVKDFAGFKRLLQENSWEDDPLSEGYPINCICARYDLLPPNPFGLPPQGYGCSDSKASAVSSWMTTSIISGPGHQSQPVFEYNGTFVNIPHKGQPTVWNFEWIETKAAA